MKWTPLFTFEAELGREAPAHSGRGSSRVRPSIVFPIPGPRAGVYGWSQGRPSDCGSGSVSSQETAHQRGLQGAEAWRKALLSFGQSCSLSQQIPSSPPPAAQPRGPAPSHPQSQGLTEKTALAEW